MSSRATDCIPETDLPRARTRGRTSTRSGAAAAAAAAPVQAPAPGKPNVETVPLNSFFGVQRSRPFVKLDKDNKAIKNRAGMPELPNEELLDWSHKANYKHGGLKGAPKPALDIAPAVDGQEAPEADAPATDAPLPAFPQRVKRAWEYYAEEKFQQALSVNPEANVPGVERKALLSAIREEVNPAAGRKHTSAAALPQGEWELMKEEDRVKYVDMWEADRTRYRAELKAYWDTHPQEKEAAQLARAARKKHAGKRKGGKASKATDNNDSEDEEEEEEEEEEEAPSKPVAKKARGSGKAAVFKGAKASKGKAAAPKKGKRKSKAVESDAEASDSEESEEEEEQMPQSESDSEMSDPEEEEEEEEEVPAKKQSKKAKEGPMFVRQPGGNVVRSDLAGRPKAAKGKKPAAVVQPEEEEEEEAAPAPAPVAKATKVARGKKAAAVVEPEQQEEAVPAPAPAPVAKAARGKKTAPAAKASAEDVDEEVVVPAPVSKAARGKKAASAAPPANEEDDPAPVPGGKAPRGSAAAVITVAAPSAALAKASAAAEPAKAVSKKAAARASSAEPVEAAVAAVPAKGKGRKATAAPVAKEPEPEVADEDMADALEQPQEAVAEPEAPVVLLGGSKRASEPVVGVGRRTKAKREAAGSVKEAPEIAPAGRRTTRTTR